MTTNTLSLLVVIQPGNGDWIYVRIIMQRNWWRGMLVQVCAMMFWGSNEMCRIIHMDQS